MVCAEWDGGIASQKKHARTDLHYMMIICYLYRWIHISLYQLMPDLALLLAQSDLFSIVFIDDLVQHHHPSQFCFILLGMVPLSQLPDLPWGFYDWVVTGVSFAFASIGRVEVSLVFVDYVTEEIFVGTADIDTRAEGLHLDSFLIELCSLDTITKVNQFPWPEFSLRKGQRVILVSLIILNVPVFWILRAALVQPRQFQSIDLPKN